MNQKGCCLIFLHQCLIPDAWKKTHLPKMWRGSKNSFLLLPLQACLPDVACSLMDTGWWTSVERLTLLLRTLTPSGQNTSQRPDGGGDYNYREFFLRLEEIIVTPFTQLSVHIAFFNEKGETEAFNTNFGTAPPLNTSGCDSIICSNFRTVSWMRFA